MKFVFIGGVPRSGTTMLQKILGNHPQISAGPEFDNIPNIMHLYSKMQYGIETGRHDLYYDKEGLKKNFENFINTLFQNRINPETKYISEKTPSNALVFKELLEFNSQSKCVFIVRDPRAIAASMKEVYLKAQITGASISLTKNISDYLILIDSYYKSLKEAIKKDNKRILIIYYEDITQDTCKAIEPLFKFLDLPFTRDLIDISKTNDVSYTVDNVTTEVWNTNKMKNNDAITKESINKWKQLLSKTEANYIERYYLYRDNPFLKKYNFVKKNILFDFWQSIFYKFYKP